MAQVLRDNGLSRLIDGDLERIADGFQFTEGPLELADGSILFQDIKAERTYRWTEAEGAKVLREATGAANGQTFGPDGWIYFCEQNGRRISRMRPDGSAVEAVVEEWQGKRLNSPNDIVANPEGMLYFTDPPYGVAPDARALHFQGVYTIDPAGRLALRLDDFEKPNGLALSPDGRTFYVCDTARYHVRSFELDRSGVPIIGTNRVFAQMDPGKPGGPDGMKVDQAGRVYVAVALGVWVYEPDGTLLGILEVPQRPSNLAWSGKGGETLVITAVDAVYRIRMRVKGVTPPFALSNV